jgi:hypothetical protein
LKVGQLLSIKDKIKLGINEIGMEYYGEEIFAAKEYYVFFPEFYHTRSPPKGMHGYAYNSYDMPICIMYGKASNNNMTKQIASFIDLPLIILSLLNLPNLPISF